MEPALARMKAVLVAWLFGCGLAAFIAPASWAQTDAAHGADASHGAASSSRYRVVLQVSDSDPAKWNLALNNARNIQQDLGKENVQIEIVAYGPGLPMLKADSKVAAGLAAALDSSVGLIACENTMRTTHVKRDDMYDGISYVNAGVVHIMQRQREGWAYIRP
jgi:intracellular sulfur oxidation DsrE/DsrF family protein